MCCVRVAAARIAASTMSMKEQWFMFLVWQPILRNTLENRLCTCKLTQNLPLPKLLCCVLRWWFVAFLNTPQPHIIRQKAICVFHSSPLAEISALHPNIHFSRTLHATASDTWPRALICIVLFFSFFDLQPSFAWDLWKRARAALVRGVGVVWRGCRQGAISLPRPATRTTAHTRTATLTPWRKPSSSVWTPFRTTF